MARGRTASKFALMKCIDIPLHANQAYFIGSLQQYVTGVQSFNMRDQSRILKL
jgi:hypothetical protein